MDVRRLLARLRNVLRARGARQSAAAPLAVVTSGTVSGSTGKANWETTAPYPVRRASVAMWLAEGRRLHPRRVRNVRQLIDDPSGNRACDLNSNAERAASPRISRPLEGAVPRTAPVSGTASVPAVDGIAPVRSTSVSGPVSPLPALPPDIRVDFTGELSGATLAAIEQLDATQRRLIFLRYLVEQGVYNEGFGGQLLPDQYRCSRGLVDGSGA